MLYLGRAEAKVEFSARHITAGARWVSKRHQTGTEEPQSLAKSVRGQQAARHGAAGSGRIRRAKVKSDPKRDNAHRKVWYRLLEYEEGTEGDRIAMEGRCEAKEQDLKTALEDAKRATKPYR